MAHFIDVVLQLEPPMLPMVLLPLPPHHFRPAVTPALTSNQTHEDRTR